MLHLTEISFFSSLNQVLREKFDKNKEKLAVQSTFGITVRRIKNATLQKLHQIVSISPTF
jgi:hypothetical protein